MTTQKRRAVTREDLSMSLKDIVRAADEAGCDVWVDLKPKQIAERTSRSDYYGTFYRIKSDGGLYWRPNGGPWGGFTMAAMFNHAPYGVLAEARKTNPRARIVRVTVYRKVPQ